MILPDGGHFGFDPRLPHREHPGDKEGKQSTLDRALHMLMVLYYRCWPTDAQLAARSSSYSKMNNSRRDLVTLGSMAEAHVRTRTAPPSLFERLNVDQVFC